MDDASRCQRRAQLSDMIEEKLDLIANMKSDLQQKRATVGNTVDDQISIAELEYRLAQEEMALLSLQEQHWEAAALWDLPRTPDIQKEVCEVLHSYICSVKEKGSIPALHASEHLALENSVLISSQSGKPSIPKVEWAHHSTDLQIGDRLLEVNGHLVIGKDSSEVSQILNNSRPVCRIVFLRPLSAYQLLKSNGCKETSNLRHELTSVVSRLNLKMQENSKLKEQNLRYETECDDLKSQNQKLKLQVLSLQSVLLCLYQLLEKKNYQSDWNTIHTTLFSDCPRVFDILKKVSHPNGTIVYSDALNSKKSIPWLELSPISDLYKKSTPKTVTQSSVVNDDKEHG